MCSVTTTKGEKNNMELICKITDEDIGEKFTNMENPKLRLGARGIVIREDGKIAIFNKSNKNEYKLPGGGIEGAKLLWETPEEALGLITKCYNELVASKYESIYATKFIVLRDRKILER